MDLFADSRQKNLDRVAPLAVRMRPRTLDEFAGQQHFLGPGKLLRRMLEADRLTSVIFYGPPGTGKTTLAQLIAGYTKSHFEQVNAAGGGREGSAGDSGCGQGTAGATAASGRFCFSMRFTGSIARSRIFCCRMWRRG